MASIAFSGYEVLFIVWQCLGDKSIFGLGQVRPIPDNARPAAMAAGLCRAVPSVERFTNRESAEKRINELGPGSAQRLRFCKNFRCVDRDLDWKSFPIADWSDLEQEAH